MNPMDATAVANRAQSRAIDPGTSVWVSASAGSGKTKVLAERVLALLLAGTAPHRILCLTFTKAAAAEMGNRISQCLAAWVTAEDRDLRDDVERLVRGKADEAVIARRGGCSPRCWMRREACRSRHCMPSANLCCGDFRWKPVSRRTSP